MMHRIISHSKHTLLMMLVMLVLLGGILPALFTVTAQLLFPTATHGSLIMRDGQVVGSELIGQEFTSDHYFWGRLSATTPPYNSVASAGSNLSMGNILLLANANERLAKLPADKDKKIPLSLITSSASGLDPHITPKAVHFQAERVAAARKVDLEEVSGLIVEYTEPPHLGFIGVARVNILALNLALDERYATR